MTFQVIPAIDLMGGRVVRLTKGDREQATFYPEEPATVAERFAQAGGQWLHVVNLDGAFDMADRANQQAVRRITSGQLSVQFGGGLRSLAAMRAAFEAGAQRLVLGTLALEQPATLAAAVDEFGPDRIAVAVDVRAGALQSHGWTEAANLKLADFLSRLSDYSVRWIIYTDAERDGTGQGLAMEAAADIQETYPFQVIVSGGVGSLADIRLARQAKLAGVIVGKALHDGRFRLEEALAC